MQAKVSGVSSVSPYLPVRIRMPCGMARVVTTASVCGNTLSSTNTTLAPDFCISRGRRAYIIVTASAQGAVGKGHAGEVAYGGLEVQEGFQASLRHFGLVGRIGGVPNGVLEHVALDYGRRHGVVPPHADVSGVEFVFGCQRRDVLSELVFGHGFGQCQRFFETDIRGDGFINQLVQAAHSDFAEHLLFVLFADADVAVSQ